VDIFAGPTTTTPVEAKVVAVRHLSYREPLFGVPESGTGPTTRVEFCIWRVTVERSQVDPLLLRRLARLRGLVNSAAGPLLLRGRLSWRPLFVSVGGKEKAAGRRKCLLVDRRDRSPVVNLLALPIPKHISDTPGLSVGLFRCEAGDRSSRGQG
jgi:hypothetical protein